MTVTDLGTRLVRLGEDLPEIIDQSFKVGLVNLRSRMKNRIFTLAKDINGKDLGKYSTNTTLIGASSFRNKTQADAFFAKEKAAQKTRKKESDQFENVDNDSGWRTVDNNKLLLLPGGYKQLRKLQGMQAEKIDLKYTGELQNTGIVTKTDGGVYQLVFGNTESMEKARGFEISHGGEGRVFGASQSEADLTVEDINIHCEKRIKEYA